MLRFLFSFRGRINRFQYWMYAIGVIFFYILVSILYDAVGEDPEDPDSVLVIFLISPGLITIYTDIVILIKRLHDTNRSGLNILWGLVPCIGSLYLLVVCGFFRGTPYKTDMENLRDYKSKIHREILI